MGTASAQQVGETLCGLVAIKQWLAEWQQLRLQFIIKGDNLGMLALFSVLKGDSVGMNKIAREYAMVLGGLPISAGCRGTHSRHS